MSVIITVSRAMLDTEQAKQWFIEQLGDIADKLTLPTKGISGDAISDKLARDVLTACRRFTKWWMYKLDGTIWKWWNSEASMNPCADRWIPESARVIIPNKRLPLRRNEVMIEQAESDAVCYAFVAGWSKTHGTEHTLGLAARRGLKTVRHDCPKEYGPNG